MNFFKKYFFPILFSMTAFLSCEIDYDLAGGENDESIPDIYMEGVVQIQTSGESSYYILKAESASLFTEEGETIFQDLEFNEQERGGGLLRYGSAGRALLHKNDAELSGGVKIVSFEDDVHIEGDSFSWKDKDQLLYSPPESRVSIIREGESEISGSGFQADFNLNEISFTNSVKGVLYHED